MQALPPPPPPPPANHPASSSLHALLSPQPTSPPPPTSAKPTRPSLPRGSACTNCRLKKLKCDGQRPVCSPCVAAAYRVRALLSSAMYGVGPEGERVDKRGRKRKGVSEDDVPECRYEDAAISNGGVGAGKDRKDKKERKDSIIVKRGDGFQEHGHQQSIHTSESSRLGTLPSFDQIAGSRLGMAMGNDTDSSVIEAVYDPVAPGTAHTGLFRSPQTMTTSDAWNGSGAGHSGAGELASQHTGYYTSLMDNERTRGGNAYDEVGNGGGGWPTSSLGVQPDHEWSTTASTRPLSVSNAGAGPGTAMETTATTFASPPSHVHDHRGLYDFPQSSSLGSSFSPLRTARYPIQPPLAVWELNVGVPPGGAGDVEIEPGSALEYALIYHILPHTPHLSIPVYPPRFLESLLLPLAQRPHPSLLYILFAESARSMINSVPLPPHPAHIPPRFPPPHPEWVHHVRAQGDKLPHVLFERARRELECGIRAVDRPYDLVRASIGISRYLYSVGRFIEGWNVPCTRLVVSCGIHRITNPIVISPETAVGRDRKMSASYMATDQGGPSPPTSTISFGGSSDHVASFSSLGIAQGHGSGSASSHTPASTAADAGGRGSGNLAVDLQAPTKLRMKPVIIQPPRDPFELAERIQTFWAIKAMDWAACVGWGWTGSLADSDVQTVWPRPYVEYEEGTVDASAVSSIWDLMNPQYAARVGSSQPMDTTQIMAYKTLCLLHKATSLFDLPHPPSTIQRYAGPAGTSSRDNLPIPHPMTSETIHTVHEAIQAFRATMPQDPPLGESDPWWIMTQVNLYCAEMLLHAEEAVYQPSKHELAVMAARKIVSLVERLGPENCTHLDLVVTVDISLAARFLYLEAARLQRAGCPQHIVMAAEREAAILHNALNDKIGRWMPMARLHGMIVQRVREGLPEKDGEYERV